MRYVSLIVPENMEFVSILLLSHIPFLHTPTDTATNHGRSLFRIYSLDPILFHRR